MKQIKNKRPITAKQYISIGFAVLGLVIGSINAVAIELEGIVVDKREDNLDTNLYIRVDAKRPYDHIIKILSSQMSNSLGRGLDMMITEGSIIVFEDDGMAPNKTARRGDMRRIISVDGISVLEMFPDRQNAFPYAIEKQKNQQSSEHRKDNPYKTILANSQPAILSQRHRRVPDTFLKARINKIEV